MRWAIFSDESESYRESDSVEGDFCSREEAESAIQLRYLPDDELHAHEVEETEEDEEDEEGED